MIKFILPSLILISFGCKSKNPIQNDSLKSINKVIIIDKTNRPLNFGKVTFTDSSSIVAILKETNNLKRIVDSSHFTGKQPYVTANFGFFDVFLYKDDLLVDNIQVCYTIYNGVVIIKNLKNYYKNDNLEMLISVLLQRQENKGKNF